MLVQCGLYTNLAPVHALLHFKRELMSDPGQLDAVCVRLGEQGLGMNQGATLSGSTCSSTAKAVQNSSEIFCRGKKMHKRLIIMIAIKMDSSEIECYKCNDRLHIIRIR